MAESSFDLFCPQCNVVVEAYVIAEGRSALPGKAADQTDAPQAEYPGDRYSVCLCRRCSQAFFLRQSPCAVPGELKEGTIAAVLYPSESTLSTEALPEAVKTAYDQAARSFRAALFEACVLMSRKCLEAVCNIFDAEARDLSTRLSILHEAGHIDSRLLNWAYQIPLIGDDAAYDIDSEVTREDARDVFEFTEAILIYIFSIMKRFESLKVRRPKSHPPAETDRKA